MKLNNKFKLIEIRNVEREPRLLISKRDMRFNQPLTVAMEYVEHVKIYLNSEDKLLAIVPCTKTAPGATRFYKKSNKKCKNPSWANQRFIKLLAKLNGWDLEKNSYALYPEKLEDGGMFFDFSKAKVIDRS